MEFGSSKGGVVVAEESSRGARGVGLESSRPVLGLESSRHGVLREWGFSSMEFFFFFFPWAFPGEVAVGVAAARSWELGLESSQLGVEDWSFLGGGYESSRPVWAWGVGRCSSLGMAWALQQRRGALGAVAAGGVVLGRGLLISFGG